MDKVILKSKPKLINWLKLDSIHILQYVQTKEIITTSEYDKLMSMKVSGDVVIKLLDIVHGKGENVCRDFLNLLKDDDVNEFSPELREWIKTVDTSVQNPDRDGGKGEDAKISIQETTGQSSIQVKIQNPDRDWEKREIQDYQKFLKAKTSQLVQRVKNIDPVIDDLILGLHSEAIANVRANSTRQQKMRELLDCVNCESIAKELVDALFKHEESLMKELQH